MMKLSVKPGKKNSIKLIESMPKGRRKGRKPQPPSRKQKNKTSSMKDKNGITCSQAGNAFLKASLAPPDFSGISGFRGIPDEYSGNTVVKTFSLTDGLPPYTIGHDLYLIQLPLPGIAYGYFSMVPGSDTPGVINLVPYPEYTTISEPGFADINFQAFRFASNVLEFMPTVNEMTWGGSIQVWKSTISATFTTDSVSPQYTLQEGLEGFSSIYAAKPQNIFPLNRGAYVPAFSKSNEYSFSKVITGINFSLLNTTQALNTSTFDRWTFAFPVGTTPSDHTYIGMGEFETTIMKFPSIIGGQSGVVRTWSSIEFQVNPTSFLYDYAVPSAGHDPIALALLDEYRKTLPCGVDYYHNATFWENFRKWVSNLSGAVSHIPGPIGLIASGIKALSDNGHGLWSGETKKEKTM